MLRYAMLRRRLVVWEVSGGYVLEEDEEGRRGAREEGGVGAGGGGKGTEEGWKVKLTNERLPRDIVSSVAE